MSIANSGNLEVALKAIKHYGFGSLCFRLRYEIMLRTGLLQKNIPAYPWSKKPLGSWFNSSVPSDPTEYIQWHIDNNNNSFFFRSSDFKSFTLPGENQIIAKADNVLAGRVHYFSNLDVTFDLYPDWFSNPFTSQSCASNIHWSQIRDFDLKQGDIKFIWEPSRFSWVYPLVRAFAITGHEKYVEHFWKWFDDWIENNPPNRGPNYKCGQECSIRCLAVCFALFAFWESPSSTPGRISSALVMLAVHADRIEKNINYARYQNNNHGISEANGLYTIGTLFPEFESATRWRRLGKKVLEESGAKQIAEDGSYLQNSMNYHRLMLQNYLWAFRLAELNNDVFSEKLRSKLLRATDFLYQMQEEHSGRVPNFGANDGALIVPLNNCDYLDYRPVLESMNYLLRKKITYRKGPWEEDLIWFFGPDALNTAAESVPRINTGFTGGGYFTLRNDRSMAMIRCHTHKTRPSHADMLSLDLWFKDINILRDSGSYMYTCPQPWQDYFVSTFAHNTIAVNGMNQMSKGSRFMWLDWTKSKLTQHKSYEGGYAQIFQGEHYGYCRKGMDIIHRRAVLSLADMCYVVVDDLLGSGIHELKILWHLADVEYNLVDNVITLNTPHGPVCLTVLSLMELTCSCSRGDEDIPAGWDSLYYGQRRPAPVLTCSTNSELPLRMITLVSLGDTLEKVTLHDNDTISWLSGKNQHGHMVGFNAIANSEEAMFSFTQDDARKVLFNPALPA